MSWHRTLKVAKPFLPHRPAHHLNTKKRCHSEGIQRGCPKNLKVNTTTYFPPMESPKSPNFPAGRRRKNLRGSSRQRRTHHSGWWPRLNSEKRLWVAHPSGFATV